MAISLIPVAFAIKFPPLLNNGKIYRSLQSIRICHPDSYFLSEMVDFVAQFAAQLISFFVIRITSFSIG